MRGDAGEHDHEVQGGVDDVLGRDHPQGGEHRGGGQDAEDDVLGDHDADSFGLRDRLIRCVSQALAAEVRHQRPSRAGFEGGGSGTVSIHSPSLSLSWSRSAMWGSEYSNSGLQNRASNGHTSTQIPQYMQSA